MNKKAKILTLLGAMLLVVLVVAANVWRMHSTVRDVRVEIDYCGADTLVQGSQVAALVRQQMPSIDSVQLRDVDLHAVERIAASSPYLKSCQASTSIGGAVVLYVVQRRPIVRVFADDQEFYLDDEGYRVPLSGLASADVIVANGNLRAKGPKLKDVWLLASYLDQHPDIAPLFDQIYRDAHGDLFLTPKLGTHVVQLGSVAYLDDKFHNLVALYTRGLPQAGWETYSQVSVKYRGQVVCTKRQK